ncbi:MAG: TraB/GumN family protein [Treponema sp.]|nr:TraB/GumN family protein [Treponema sp.]
MKRLTVLFLGILLSAGTAAAESSVWKLTKDGGSLYLGGSVHALRMEDYPIPEEFDIAFERSAMLILETDIDQLADSGVTLQLVTRMFLPDNKTLATVLNKETFKKLADRCVESGVSIETFMRYTPSMVVHLLGTLQAKEFGFNMPGADLVYASRAKETSKGIGFLEPLETQIELLTNAGNGFADEYVLCNLNDWDKAESVLNDFVTEWKKGSGKKLTLELKNMKETYPHVYKSMFLDRNNNWIPVIEAYLNTPEIEFIIAGLGHFYGPDGLLVQLKNRGCRIEQVKLEQGD